MKTKDEILKMSKKELEEYLEELEKSEKLNLYQKLIEIRKIVPYLKKDTKGYNYSYVSGSSILSELTTKMNELGVLLVPSILEYAVNQTEKKQIITCKMMMTWINAENPEERLEVPFACFGAQDDISKAFGSALTYSERYFLLKFFNIATDDMDPDRFQTKQNSGKKQPINTIKAVSTKAIEESSRVATIDDIEQMIMGNADLTERVKNFLISASCEEIDELSDTALFKLHEKVRAASKG